MLVTVIAKTLELKHAFTISRGSKIKAESVFVSVKHEGLEGWGEASPNSRYQETPESCLTALAVMLDGLSGHPFYPDSTLKRVFRLVEGQYAAKAALDMALHDYLGKQLRAPFYRILGFEDGLELPTSFTIAMASPELMAERAREATGFSCLKIKVGGEMDRANIAAIRKATDKPLRVDANEAWTDRTMALREIEWLADQGVVLVEQPMPAQQLEDAIWLKQRSPLPLFADEAFTTPQSVLHLASAYHGINIKLQKCGGTLAARESITLARALGLQTMMGCMVESSLSVAAAAHLAPAVDFLDLDGFLFLNNNPFDGLDVNDGRLVLGTGPGFGVVPNSGIMMADDSPDFGNEDFD